MLRHSPKVAGISFTPDWMLSIAHRLPVGGGGWLDRTLNKEGLKNE
jgi:hypothetical protein